MEEVEDIHREKIDKTKNIVFVKSKQNIHSAISLSQYIYNGITLITLIGELHKETFKCDEPSLSIAEYCRNATEHNPNCRVMLEYEKEEDISTWSDSTIKETFDSLNKSQIIPFDERPNIITREKQYDLYWRDWSSFDTATHGDVYVYISTWYIKPFFDKVADKDLTILLPARYFNPVSRGNLVSYYNFLKKSFNQIQTMIKSKQSIGDIKQQLQISWAQVADFYILKKLFTVNDKINEYIVILGEYHKRNIKNFIEVNSKSDKDKNLYYSLGNKQKDLDKDGKIVCVNIYTTYSFNLEK
jgi:hypothetical protein